MNFWSQLPSGFTALAPMEDVTDTVFRRLICECGRPNVFFTEFTSTDGMFSPGKDRVIERLEFTEVETPLVAQIWGKNPENYFQASKELVARGFQGIDINMGCPVPKITTKGCCSALIDNQNLAKELILAAREGVNSAKGNIPISVKTRLGFKEVDTESWASFLLELNLPALTIHGRVAKHQSKYPADWSEIAKVVQLKNEINPCTTIIGNGDLFSQEIIKDKIQESGVDGVMIGRGIFQNPYIFNQTGITDINQLSTTQKLQLLLRHLELHRERWGETACYSQMKRFYKVYVANFANASELRVLLMETTQVADANNVIKAFISNLTDKKSSLALQIA